MESANVFPNMRGIATGMSNALRFVITSGIVMVGSLAFNGSIKPVAILLGISSTFVMVFVMMLSKKSLKSAKYENRLSA